MTKAGKSRQRQRPRAAQQLPAVSSVSTAPDATAGQAAAVAVADAASSSSSSERVPSPVPAESLKSGGPAGTTTRRRRPPSIADGLQQMNRIVSQLILRQDAVPFRTPVYWREMGLYDYPEKIKRPTDLGTIKEALERGDYRTPDEVATDIRRVWENCIVYNAEGSELHSLAISFAARFEEKYAKLAEHLRAPSIGSSGAPEDREPTPLMKRVFAESIPRLRMEDLTAIIDRLDARCPHCLSNVEGVDEVEIRFDDMDPRTFHEVFAIVERRISAL